LTIIEVLAVTDFTHFSVIASSHCSVHAGVGSTVHLCSILWGGGVAGGPFPFLLLLPKPPKPPKAPKAGQGEKRETHLLLEKRSKNRDDSEFQFLESSGLMGNFNLQFKER